MGDCFKIATLISFYVRMYGITGKEKSIANVLVRKCDFDKDYSSRRLDCLDWLLTKNEFMLANSNKPKRE